jgi:predicted glycoside hydrolase/deacetylase ChbG (UPF0249 family)
MTRAFVLCADDYAHTPAVSRAILDLAQRGRISALSCMTAAQDWPEHGLWLNTVKDKVDIGLHLTLVDETPLTAMPHTAPDGKLPGIAALIKDSYLGRLDLIEIEAELRAQIAAFQRVMGFTPHHIDGHLHTHVLPGIRDVVLKVTKEMTLRPYLRNISDRLPAISSRSVAVPKAAFLALLGRGLRKTDARMNTSFSGVYDFTARQGSYGALFERFIEQIGPKHLILCHPGEATDTAAHTDARAAEYAFLKSEAFAALLSRNNLRLGRFAETAA